MTWNVAFAPEAEPGFDKLDPLVASAFLAALDELAASDPYEHERLMPVHFPFRWDGWLFKPRVDVDGKRWLVTSGVRIDVPGRTIWVGWVFAQHLPDYGNR